MMDQFYISQGIGPSQCLEPGHEQSIKLSNDCPSITIGGQEATSPMDYVIQSPATPIKVVLQGIENNCYKVRIEEIYSATNVFGAYIKTQKMVPTPIPYSTPFFIAQSELLDLCNIDLNSAKDPGKCKVNFLQFNQEMNGINIRSEVKELPLYSFTIGRSPMDDNVFISSALVSVNHCQLDWNYLEYMWYITDRGRTCTGSTFGVWVKLQSFKPGENPYKECLISKNSDIVIRLGMSSYIKLGLNQYQDIFDQLAISYVQKMA